MVELLTVIAVIGILAAAAAPSFVEFMRDRRVSDAASNIAELYRTARSRAMGRGSATMVRWNETAALPTDSNPEGHFGMREAVMGPATPFHARLPSTSCLAADFSVGSTTSAHIAAFDERRQRYAPAQATFRNPNNTDVGYAEICYTPRGRSFIRYSPGAGWQALTGVPTIEVLNGDTSLRRFVVLPPNGAARIETRIQ